MLKLSDNPPVLPLGISALSELQGAWWVAHTKARNEKAFVWDMAEAGISYYLPMARRVTISGGRKRTLMKPLFPGYVFVCGDGETRYRALMTHRLCQVIPILNRDQFVAQLASIETAINSGISIDLYPFAAVGKYCRIAKGPLEGMRGIVVRRDQSTRFILEVSILGTGASVEIDADLLEAAE